ncbi:hypothetical protein ACFWPX_34385 [Nocardia sp. NPDC058518]|uniref:hypothetical protein n=1 Tax=Nocardia sp. NPDC058518 TaxID=3346534 RepID=UPI00365CCD99
MPHGTDIAAEPLSTRSTHEGAADMARYTTFRDALSAPEPLTLPTPRRARTAAQFPSTRRSGSESAIRGAQTRSTTVRRPIRIPGR